MEINNQITKDQVKEIFRTSKNGGEIAKAVCDYFKLNFKPLSPALLEIPEQNILEFADKIFNGPVDTPGVAVV